MFREKIDEIVLERREEKRKAQEFIEAFHSQQRIDQLTEEERQLWESRQRRMNLEIALLVSSSNQDEVTAKREEEQARLDSQEARRLAVKRFPDLHAAAQQEIKDLIQEQDRIYSDRLAAERLEFLKTKHWPNLAGRFRDVSLENFEEHGETEERENQRRVLAELRRLNLPQAIRDGKNILFIGPPGAGKDHLMHSLMSQVFLRLNGGIVCKNGANLRVELRDAIRGEAGGEDAIVDKMVKAPLLCLSDPAPTGGSSLTDFQADCLYRVADGRWKNKRPIWLTANLPVTSIGTHAKEIFSGPVWDRLIDGSLLVRCNWSSYRKCLEVIQ